MIATTIDALQAFARGDGASPSGKAADFESAIRRFESFRPNKAWIHYDAPSRPSRPAFAILRLLAAQQR